MRKGSLTNALQSFNNESRPKKSNVKVVCVTLSIIAITILVIVLVNLPKKKAPTVAEGVQAMNEFYSEAIIGNEGQVEVYSAPELQDIITLGDLQTLSYHYNSIKKVRIDHDIRYYVAYEGVVQMGVDFDKIQIDFDTDNFVIKVTLPPIKVTNSEIVASSLDFIFMDESYNNENTFSEAFSLCQEDIVKDASEDERLCNLAMTNTEAEVKALINPFLDEYYPEYQLVVEWEANTNSTPEDLLEGVKNQ